MTCLINSGMPHKRLFIPEYVTCFNVLAHNVRNHCTLKRYITANTGSEDL